jgi:hypothetical protein
MSAWLAQRASMPILGPWLVHEWAAYFFSYFGILIDLSIVPLLLWRRTRWLGLAVAIAFNVTNAVIFSIGIFPWFMIAASLLFFEPSWPRRVIAWAQEWIGVADSRRIASLGTPPRFVGERLSIAQRLTVTLLGLFVAFQLLFPFRHLLYPGDVAWNEEGHRFSWRMKLRDKRGSAQFFVTDSRGYTWQVSPREYVTALQADEMVGRPDMIIQLAHHIAADYRERGFGPVEVRARVLTSLNGRPRRPLIDPTVDLVAQSRSIWPATWIMPLDEPLARR